MTHHPISLCIKYNSVATNDPCGICGQRTDPVVGPEAFIDGTADLVCRQCVKDHDPLLAAILAALPVEFDPWVQPDEHGCTCGPQGAGHLYVSTTGTEVVHRPWCDMHPDDCIRADCCAGDTSGGFFDDDTPACHLRLVTP